MSLYATGNPVPSSDMRDIWDDNNIQDRMINGTDLIVPDRTGKDRDSWAGIEKKSSDKLSELDEKVDLEIEHLNDEINLAMEKIGWQELGDWSVGLQVTNRNQIVSYDGSWYKFLGELPHTIAEGSPENDGGIWSSSNTSGVWANIGDAAIRNELHALTGSSLIGGLGYLTPEMFGAKGDGVTDDRPAIQSAIDKSNANYLAGTGPRTVYLGSQYRVTLNPASTLIPGEVAAGRGVLNIRSGVSIEGPGTLALDTSFTGGSSGAVITNWEGSADYCAVKGITIDGAYGTATGTGITGINIVDSANVDVSFVKVINTTAGGIYLRRAGNSSSDYGCSNSKIVTCRVNNTRYIGIQCERPNGMIIANSIITNTGDNGIDIEGNQSGITSTGYAEGVVIVNNEMSGVKNGIFIESCGQAKVVSNTIYTPGIGIVFNRINSGSFYNEAIANTINGIGVSDTGMGMRFINQIGRMRISENRIRFKANGLHFADRIDRMDIGVNYFSDISSVILAFDKVNSGVSMLRSRIASQFYAGTQTSGIPYPTSPRNNPANYPNRMASTVSYAPVYFSDLAGSGEDNMVYRTATLSYNSSWAAYARYGIVTDGYTSLNGNFGNAGEYLEINGNYYQIYSVETSTTEILKWDGSSWASGNFVGDFTDAFAVKTHRSVWGTL